MNSIVSADRMTADYQFDRSYDHKVAGSPPINASSLAAARAFHWRSGMR
jgi:hypothetical protein